MATRSLAESGMIERVVSFEPSDESASPEQSVGTLQVKLRLEPAGGEASAPTPSRESRAATNAPLAAASEKTSKAAATASRPGNVECAACDAKARELAHRDELIERLMDDVKTRNAAVAKAGEEVMDLRGVNKQLETDLAALRKHVDERERAMEQLAGDATNVENIDLPQLQSRHRMLGAAYRADRRKMEGLTSQVAADGRTGDAGAAVRLVCAAQGGASRTGATDAAVAGGGSQGGQVSADGEAAGGDHPAARVAHGGSPQGCQARQDR